MNTNPDTSSVIDRGNGFKAGIAKFPNIKLVGMDYCMDNQQKAMELTTAALQKYPDIVGIFGVNVFSAQGSAQAVKNAGLVGAVKIASWDATATLIAALKDGDIDMVLAQLPGEIGALGVEAGFKYLTAKTMPQKKIIPGVPVLHQGQREQRGHAAVPLQVELAVSTRPGRAGPAPRPVRRQGKAV